MFPQIVVYPAISGINIQLAKVASGMIYMSVWANGIQYNVGLSLPTYKYWLGIVGKFACGETNDF